MNQDPKQPQSDREARLPWVVPMLKKGTIGVETGNNSGRRFDGAHSSVS
ncbi:MAG: hypothetical protein IPL96_02925 [Holophagaceae bacterium]|nr:hypothetical protein [Holophagaceae bacterium]